MAIQKSYTDIYGATHAESYTRILSVYTNDEAATLEIHIWHNAAARSKADASARKQPLVTEVITLMDNAYTTYFSDSALKANTKSPAVQAYAWLKTNDSFIGADWTSGTTDV